MSGQVLFVSGIDTDVGKTVATGVYAKKLMQQGFSVITQKMIQTGCKGIADDIVLHRKIQGIGLQPEDRAGLTCPYLFAHPCSPHLAAQLEQVRIEADKISAATAQLAAKYDYVLLEGAGGLAVPYNETDTSLDYLLAQRYPLILVTCDKLGSINHTLLSLMVCQQKQIVVDTLIYNRYPMSDKLITQSTQHYLENYLTQHFPHTQFMCLDKIDI